MTFSSVSNFEVWPAKGIRHAVIQVSSSRWLPVKKGGVGPVRLTLPGSCLTDSQFGFLMKSTVQIYFSGLSAGITEGFL